MTDRADLIRRLEEAAKQEDATANEYRAAATLLRIKQPRWAQHHDARAALLREAAKALGGGE